MSIRILIADRQKMFREVLRRLLESEREFAVVGETDDGQGLPQLAADLNPDILLMNKDLCRRPGLESLREVTARTATRPILLVDRITNGEIIQALLWGARGIVRKNDATSLLLKSIRTVKTGEYWINHAGISELVSALCSLSTRVEQQAQQQTHSLSVQQLQIVEAIVNGCSNKEIARDLRLSERTVKYHLTRIFNKFGVSGRMELARYSLKNRDTRQA
jgi:two-component system, NarL family, nitrate/nitrite response regulator NarL